MTVVLSEWREWPLHYLIAIGIISCMFIAIFTVALIHWCRRPRPWRPGEQDQPEDDRLDRENIQKNDIPACPCGPNTAVKMQCNDCHQPAYGCSVCHQRLGLCACDDIEDNEDVEKGLELAHGVEQANEEQNPEDVGKAFELPVPLPHEIQRSSTMKAKAANLRICGNSSVYPPCAGGCQRVMVIDCKICREPVKVCLDCYNFRSPCSCVDQESEVKEDRNKLSIVVDEYPQFTVSPMSETSQSEYSQQIGKSQVSEYDNVESSGDDSEGESQELSEQSVESSFLESLDQNDNEQNQQIHQLTEKLEESREIIADLKGKLEAQKEKEEELQRVNRAAIAVYENEVGTTPERDFEALSKHEPSGTMDQIVKDTLDTQRVTESAEIAGTGTDIRSEKWSAVSNRSAENEDVEKGLELQHGVSNRSASHYSVLEMQPSVFSNQVQKPEKRQEFRESGNKFRVRVGALSEQNGHVRVSLDESSSAMDQIVHDMLKCDQRSSFTRRFESVGIMAEKSKLVTVRNDNFGNANQLHTEMFTPSPVIHADISKDQIECLRKQLECSERTITYLNNALIKSIDKGTANFCGPDSLINYCPSVSASEQMKVLRGEPTNTRSCRTSSRFHERNCVQNCQRVCHGVEQHESKCSRSSKSRYRKSTESNRRRMRSMRKRIGRDCQQLISVDCSCDSSREAESNCERVHANVEEMEPEAVIARLFLNKFLNGNSEVVKRKRTETFSSTKSKNEEIQALQGMLDKSTEQVNTLNDRLKKVSESRDKCHHTLATVREKKVADCICDMDEMVRKMASRSLSGMIASPEDSRVPSLITSMRPAQLPAARGQDEEICPLCYRSGSSCYCNTQKMGQYEHGSNYSAGSRIHIKPAGWQEVYQPAVVRNDIPLAPRYKFRLKRQAPEERNEYAETPELEELSLTEIVSEIDTVSIVHDLQQIQDRSTRSRQIPR